jgi:hypothetical protein
MTDELSRDNDLQGSGSGKIRGNITACAWSDCIKSR